MIPARETAQQMRPRPAPDGAGGKDAALAENRGIAADLRAFADLLAAQAEDGFRIRAYRRAADRIDALGRALRDIHAADGIGGLIALPDIGTGIADAIVQMLTGGRWAQLDRLRGEAVPERLFRSLPGVGPILSDRLVSQLDVQTLEELETALRDPAMTVPGLGLRRRQALLASLAQRLQPIRRARGPSPDAAVPPVSLLLNADTLYRRKAQAGELRLIAPRRHNPAGVAWLPVLHLRRGDWHLTLLQSNSALAHDLGRVGDWVVIYFHHGDGPEGQATVVTETQGALARRRVVRGREADCARHYAAVGAG
jgi:hypothetical protein